MKRAVKLLVNEKLHLEEILSVPMNVLSNIGQEENVTWKSFESKKAELENELAQITTALLTIDPNKEFH